MDALIAFGISFSIALITYSLMFGIFLLPRLRKIPFYKALIGLLLIHCFRTVALMMIVPTTPDHLHIFPKVIAEAIACGELISAVLALTCVLTIHYTKMRSLLLVWIFSLVGMGCLVLVLINIFLYQTTTYEVGVNWLILHYYVPLLWVSHVLIIQMIMNKKI
ncbi:MAG: hypothetical protein AAF587_40885 [Bacteroidota bacterium]